MTVNEIVDKINSEKKYFGVSIPGTKFLLDANEVNLALSNGESKEDYLTRIANENKAKEIIVELFVRAGSVKSSGTQRYSTRGKHHIFFGLKNSAYAPAYTPAYTPEYTPAYTQEFDKTTPLNGLDEPFKNNTITPKNTAMQDKDYIDFKVLELSHKQLESLYNDSTSKIAKLEKKVDELHDENKQLLRDNTTKEDKHALALERAKLEMEKEGKDGLSGVMDFANNNPETVKMLLGAIFPNNPNFKTEPEQKALGAAQEIGNIKYTADDGANQVLNDIPLKLSQKDGDTIAKIYMLFQTFMSNNDVLNATVKQIIPEYPL